MTTVSSSIPHVIYFFWDHVGKVLPPYARKNIATWHSFFPDYQIKAITNLDFEPSTMPFTKKAYEAKRYGYAVDYIRLAFLYQHGGLYFDLDVEVIKDMRDIVEKGPFFALDGSKEGGYNVNPGSGFGVAPGCSLIRKLMVDYENWNRSSFLNERGFPSVSPSPIQSWHVFLNYGVKEENVYQNIDGISFYPTDFFGPMDIRTRKITLTENTRTIHHYTGSGNSALDLWMNRYRSRLLAKRNGKEMPYRLFQFRLYIFHPIKALRYHFAHRRK
jgi:hypothetical protein